MATNVEYALMAANVYDAVRTDANDIPVPLGWDRIRYIADGPRPQGPAERNNFGFSAGVFRRGNEVVIAFVNKIGTEPGFLSGAGGTETGLRPY